MVLKNQKINFEQTYHLLGNVDIYVIDQILKGRYASGSSILDAGCGSGRNLKWFSHNDFSITGIDHDAERIYQAKKEYANTQAKLLVGTLDELPFEKHSYDHILCCAVLHFAENKQHFGVMFSELIRVLKPKGTLLIRIASDIGLNGKKPFVQDGSSQQIGMFYLTRPIISELIEQFPITLIEPIKTTNVQDLRAMTTLVFEKKTI